MAKAGFRTVDEYIASRPATVRSTLKKLRSIVREALPDAEEVISYQIPAYRLGSRTVLFFAGWSEHYSLYPAGGRLSDSLKKALAGYELRRGTIRFELSKPIPEKLITRIAKFRAQEATEEVKARAPKTATSRRRSKRKRKRV